MTTRRRLLFAGAGVLRAAPQGERIIDSHVHLFLPEFAYHPNATYRPATHPLSEYLEFAAHAPIEHALVVHPEPYQDDHRVLGYIFRHEPSHLFFKATCLFDPIDPRTPERMAALSRQYPGRIAGMRIHEIHKAGTPPSTGVAIKDRDFRHPGFKNVFQQARQLKMMVQFQLIPCYAGAVYELAHQFPEVPIVLDHLGRAHEGTAEEVDRLMLLGKLGNVFIKYSGPYTGDAALARRAFDVFGPNQMMCGYVGTNAGEYRTWSSDFERAFGRLGEADRERLRVATAKMLFRW
jgi:predicted TIM-barrel fold metal-dependent hydrolase